MNSEDTLGSVLEAFIREHDPRPARGHHDPQFTETRQRLDGLESAPAEHWWHDVVLDVRKASTPPPPTAKSPSKRRAKGKTKSPRRCSA
jgi:hypothetical protein